MFRYLADTFAVNKTVVMKVTVSYKNETDMRAEGFDSRTIEVISLPV